jgi:hypothetical protein
VHSIPDVVVLRNCCGRSAQELHMVHAYKHEQISLSPCPRRIAGLGLPHLTLLHVLREQLHTAETGSPPRFLRTGPMGHPLCLPYPADDRERRRQAHAFRASPAPRRVLGGGCGRPRALRALDKHTQVSATHARACAARTGGPELVHVPYRRQDKAGDGRGSWSWGRSRGYDGICQYLHRSACKYIPPAGERK